MPPILALEKISKRFGAVVVAEGVDLALEPGEALGIIGPNGAGKTTLFGIATGAVAPDSGRVLYEGKDITRLAPERRCRLGLARSFQIPQPFSGMTVFENVVVAAAFGGNEGETAVYARLRRVDRALRAWPTRPTGAPAASRCSTANGLSLRARWRRGRACCCSTKWPAGSPSTNARRLLR